MGSMWCVLNGWDCRKMKGLEDNGACKLEKEGKEGKVGFSEMSTHVSREGNSSSSLSS
jgi:hypothetical protein